MGLRIGLRTVLRIMPTVCLIGTVLLAAAAGSSGDAIEQVGPGLVNWTTGTVTAVGTGAPSPSAVNPAQARAMAERAAHVAALRNLLEAIKAVRVDSATLVENYLVQSDVIRTRVAGIVKGARAIRTEHLPDGGVEVTVAVSLSGDLSDAVLPKDLGRRLPAPTPSPPARVDVPPKPQEGPATQSTDLGRTRPLPKEPPHEPVVRSEPPVPPAPATPPASPAVVYTGLIVDARGLGLRPALVPRLLDERGQEVYAADVLSREQAVQNGVAGYSRDLVAASRQARVTDNPLIVKGIRVSGSKGTDIVLGEDAVGKIKQTETMSQFLKQARVVVVYD